MMKTDDLNSTCQDNEQEDSKLYEYNEEESSDTLDDSPMNYSQSSGISQEKESEIKEGKGTKKNSPFILLVKVLCNPLQGWRSVRRSKLTVEESQRGCFYPLLAIMSLCYFARIFYSPTLSISDVIVSALSAFVGFFAGYFCIMILLKLLLPTSVAVRIDSTYGKVFVILNLSSLCLFFSALELFPMLWDVLIFLPLWTVYVISKGAHFLNFPDNKKIQCTGILCLLIIGVPVLIEWGLNEILPN